VLNQADVLIEGGADLEASWLPPLVNGARNAKIVGDGPGHLSLARFVTMLDVPTGPIDRSMGDVHPFGNPHFNLDPKNGGRMADAMAEALARLDPAHAEEFRKNARDFNARLTARLEQWMATLAPWKGAKVVTYHRSYDYFLHRFGFELAGTIEPKPGIEPSPSHLNGLIPKMKQGGVKLILAEPNRPHGIPERLAEASGARLLRLPGQVGGSPAVTDYLSFIDDTVRRVAEALKAGLP
jgi:zinc/manganese transport system substrate-binding protein